MVSATTTCEVMGSSTQCTTETAEYYLNGFSFGDIMIIFLLILLLTMTFFNNIKTWLVGLKIHNQVRPDFSKDI